MLMAFSETGNGKYGRAKTAIVFFAGIVVPSMPSSPMFAGMAVFRGTCGSMPKAPIPAQGVFARIRPDDA